MIQYNNKKIIVIDGADGVGKSTQIELLKTQYPTYNFNKFPVYSSDTGYYITQYLYNKLDHILPIDNKYFTDIYRASMLYTMDRVMWFSKYYCPGNDLICDRYTTSNMIHMSANILLHGGTMDNVITYINYLEDLEYNILDIPRPTNVIYLDAPVDHLIKNLSSRSELDKHENIEMLKKIDMIKAYLIHWNKWNVIDCYENGQLKSIEEINSMIQKLI